MTKTDYNVILILIFALLLCLVFPHLLSANIQKSVTVDHVERSILWLERYGHKGRFSLPDDYRRSISKSFVIVSREYKLPTFLLVSIGYNENVFRTKGTGPDGELGIMQVGSLGREKCACDMETPHGQIDCGACWLKQGINWCGDLVSGFYAYVSGKCRSNHPNVIRVVQSRFNDWQRLKHAALQ